MPGKQEETDCSKIRHRVAFITLNAVSKAISLTAQRAIDIDAQYVANMTRHAALTKGSEYQRLANGA
jgi:hypothetical protein